MPGTETNELEALLARAMKARSDDDCAEIVASVNRRLHRLEAEGVPRGLTGCGSGASGRANTPAIGSPSVSARAIAVGSSCGAFFSGPSNDRGEDEENMANVFNKRPSYLNDTVADWGARMNPAGTLAAGWSSPPSTNIEDRRRTGSLWIPDDDRGLPDPVPTFATSADDEETGINRSLGSRSDIQRVARKR